MVFGLNSQFYRVRWTRAAALSLALFAIFLTAIGASYWHQDKPGSEAACQICHVSHMPVLVGVVVSVQVKPRLVAWVDPAEVQVSHSAAAVLDFPPRAPPA